jgi:endo-1,4-beta-xylanase
MASSCMDRRVSLLTSVLGPTGMLLLAVGCSSGGGVDSGAGGSLSGGNTGNSGAPGKGGSIGTGGVSSSGGVIGVGGTPGSGGVPGSGGIGKGGNAGTGGVTRTGGSSGKDAGPASGGAPGSGGAAIDGGVAIDGGTVNCSATMPSGGTTCSGNNCNGQADGLGYGIWESGSGGSITYFTNAHAFSASWGPSSADFLAHLGLDFNASKSYTAYGTITANFSETKTGSSGGWSSIGMYGWMHSPCIEWYINEDSFNGLYGSGSVTATIDGATYYLSSTTTTGTGGANACESGHSGSWTQIHSTRKTARTCGTITVSDHFAAWAAQGWNLGSLASVHINVEVGGGTGSIQFPVAEVTTTSK